MTGAATETIATVDPHGARVQNMFTRIAQGYDRANRIMSLGTDVRWRRAAVELLGETLAAGRGTGPARLLDLCAGTLDSTLEIHRRFPEASIVGGDFSAGMLDVGRAKLQGAAAQRITALELDAHALPFEDGSLDGIFCAFGIRNLSDLGRATREQARVLRSGGKLVVLEFFRPQTLWSRTFHAAYNHTVLPVVGWASTGHLDAYLYLPRSIASFDTAENYTARLRAAGFGEVRVRALTFGVASVVEATRLPAERA